MIASFYNKNKKVLKVTNNSKLNEVLYSNISIPMPPLVGWQLCVLLWPYTVSRLTKNKKCWSTLDQEKQDISPHTWKKEISLVTQMIPSLPGKKNSNKIINIVLKVKKKNLNWSHLL